MASLTRKAIEDVKKAYGIGDVNACPVCRDVYIAGMPGLFAYAYQDFRPSGGRKLTHEEARSFFYGCPECGKDVKTCPIMIRGIRSDETPHMRELPSYEIPDPWPIHEWPEPAGPPGKRGNVYDTEEEAAAWG